MGEEGDEGLVGGYKWLRGRVDKNGKDKEEAK